MQRRHLGQVPVQRDAMMGSRPHKMADQPLRVLRRSEELLRLRELREVTVAVARPLGLFQFPFLELFDALFANLREILSIEII